MPRDRDEAWHEVGRHATELGSRLREHYRAQQGADTRPPIETALEALSRQGDQTSVYIVNSAGKVEVRVVQADLETSTDAEVVSGLAEGDAVIVSDRSGLKAGEEVTPQAVQILQYHGGQ